MNSNLDPQQWGKSLFDAVTELVTTLDLNMRIQWANQDTAKSVNENPENLLGHYCFQVWYNRDIPCEECPVQMTIQTGESQESEVASPDGKYQHVRTYPLNSQEGNLEGVAVLGRDITEWKQMEKELQQRRSELEKQEELYRSLVKDHPYFVERFLPDTTIIFANNAMAESIGYPPEQLKGRKWIDFIPEEERTLILEQLAELTPEDSICSYENSCFASDGSKRLHSWTHQAFFDDQGEISYFQSVGTDVTERKQAERALQEWENYYRTIFETSGSAMFIIEHDTTISLANSNFERMTGYSRQEVEGKKSWTEFVHPDDVTWMKEKHYFRRQYPSGVPLEYEFRFFARNGELRHAYLTIDLIPETTKSVVSVVDITERKNTEAAMRRSENYYRAIFETSGAIMFIVEEDTTISHVNSNFENLTGYSRQEVEGEKSWTEFVNPGDLEWLQEYNYSLRQHPNTAPRQNEINILNRQGESKDLYLAAARIPGSNQRVVSCLDITERKRTDKILQARLRLMEKSLTHSLQEILTATIDEAENLTNSKIGFYHLLQADQRTLSIQAWSTRTKDEACSARIEATHYDIEQAGVWVDCIRRQEPVIHNNYESLPQRRGSPPGHPAIVRELVVPVYRGNNIVAVLGVGNKPENYNQADIEAVSMLANLALDITDRKQTEEALQQSKNYYRAIFETSGTAMFIIDPDTRISLANSNFADLSGYSRQEIEGKRSWTEFAHPDDVAWMKENHYLRRRDPKAASRQYEFRFITKHGEKRDVFLAVDMIPGTDQSIASCIDITESKRAEDLLRESEEQYRLLVENAFEGIGVAQDGEFKWINPRIVEMMGCSQEELTTISIFDFVHPEDKEAVIKKHYQRMQEIKPPRIYSFRILSPQNEVLWCQVSVIGINWQGRPADLCFFSDISQQKRIESELEEAKQRAEAANRSKSEFLANMSHEIRTPLNGILGMLQLLKTSALDEQQERFVDTGLDSTRRLNRLLTDILDLSKIEANKLVIKQEEFVFTDVIQTIRDIFNQLTQKNQNEINISLDENIPEMLIGDSTRLNQILFNLVGNANKYTQNGQIGLEVSLLPAVQPDNCRLLFVIADNGQGIPEDRIDRIFDIFTQGSDASYTREFEGAGLGLPLVKRLVDLMNGSISLSSKEGEGTTVYVSLPFGIPESMQQDTDDSQAAEKPFTASNSRVLVVDDDETTQLYIKRLLEMQGVATNVAEDGKEALDWLEKDDFDCILMDVQMPVLDGVEATKKIRSSNADFKKIPIVAMTAYAMTGDREKFLQAGMDDYIAKPVDKDGLLAILERNIN